VVFAVQAQKITPASSPQTTYPISGSRLRRSEAGPPSSTGQGTFRVAGRNRMTVGRMHAGTAERASLDTSVHGQSLGRGSTRPPGTPRRRQGEPPSPASIRHAGDASEPPARQFPPPPARHLRAIQSQSLIHRQARAKGRAIARRTHRSDGNMNCSRAPGTSDQAGPRVVADRQFPCPFTSRGRFS
jgi:hypothetical protein